MRDDPPASSSRRASSGTGTASTLAETLRQRAREDGDRTAFIFLPDGEREGMRQSYRELDERAREIASVLPRRAAGEARAVLLFPPGLEFVAAFMGCLYAGLVAVPLHPPRLNQRLARFRAVLCDADPAVVLTTSRVGAMLAGFRDAVPELERIEQIAVDGDVGVETAGWTAPAITPDTLAMLQYTSGSTALPKGVMLSHANLLWNQEMLQAVFRHTPACTVVGWLPLFHDMGLIGQVIHPLFVGMTSVLMPPQRCLERPLTWLRAISRFGAITSGGPNFAYDWCSRRIPPEDRAGLDLSCWRNAFNGAEPVRAETLERFAAAFAPCGFRPDAYVPCYGLAEATLIVSGRRERKPPQVRTVRRTQLAEGAVVPAPDDGSDTCRIVGCGESGPGQEIEIVDPQTCRRAAPGRVGEIWVRGPHLARGYWGRPEETREIFGATVGAGGGTGFLRTGDLGFLDGGELFVTGRSKDLIIIRGRNHYPQDIESSAAESHPGLRAGATAAFSVDVQNEERLVVVQEVDRRSAVDVAAMTSAIRRAISEQHELEVHAIVLVLPGGVPRTSSGKVQRSLCRTMFLQGRLEGLISTSTDDSNGRGGGRSARFRPPVSRIERAVAEIWSDILGVDQPGLDDSFLELGGDSLAAIRMAVRLRQELGAELELQDIFDSPVLAELVERVASTRDREEREAPLTPVAGEGPWPLSFAQERLWFIEQLHPGVPLYHIAAVLDLRGELDTMALERSLGRLVRRHDMLRTTFTTVNGRPMQRAAEAGGVALPVVDLRSRQPGDCRLTAVQLERRAARLPFDLAVGPPFRCLLARVGERQHRLILVMHHLVSDGWSMQIIQNELMAFYTAAVRCREVGLPIPPACYAEFVRWEQDRLSQATLERQRAYWRDRLRGASPVPLTPDRPRIDARPPRGADRWRQLPAGLPAALQTLGASAGATRFMVVLAAFKALLHRYTGRTDIAVGTPVTIRDRREFEQVVGLFINTLVLRTDLSGDPTFRVLLHRVRATCLEAFAHSGLPFERLVSEIGSSRGRSMPPLFNVMFVVERIADTRTSMSGLEASVDIIPTGTAKFDLTLMLRLSGEDGALGIEFRDDLFDTAMIERMLEHLALLLAEVVTDPDRRLSRLPILTADERRQLIVDRSERRRDTATETDCVHRLIEAQVARTPDAVALVCGESNLTYQALNCQANRLARHLRRLGIGPEVPVAVCMDRSIAMVVTMLAIMKAGGTYVPLETSLPATRQALLLHELEAPIVLTDRRRRIASAGRPWRVVEPSARAQSIARERADDLAEAPPADAAAYIIHTSGSTGVPKGVVVAHRALANQLAWMQATFPLQSRDRVLQKTALSFDVSVSEILAPLISGAALILAPPASEVDPPALLRAVDDHEITRLYLVPSALRYLVEEPGLGGATTLGQVLCAGEALSAALAARFGDRHAAQLINLYGPTEATIYATFCSGSPRPSREWIPIGRPIANTRAYILDRHGGLVPMGAAGELYLGGRLLARGYLRRPELTAASFVPDPFGRVEGGRLYRTGDEVRFGADREIEFLGRLDRQLKIRGCRVEPGEIEAALRSHPGVRDAVVLARADDETGPNLVAYIVPVDGSEPSGTKVRAFLRQRLPDFMVPAAVVSLPALPLGPGGKLERTALPPPGARRRDTTTAYVMPRGATEVALARIWGDLLKRERIGARDDFFELGGDSLLAMRMAARIRDVFGIDLGLGRMLRASTLGDLARLTEATAAAKERTEPEITISRRHRAKARLEDFDPAATPPENRAGGGHDAPRR